MKQFTANRLAKGNALFPAEIHVDNFGVTLKVPGLFNGQQKSLTYDKISSVSIDTPLLGFSKITFDTIGYDYIHAEGFEKVDAEKIKELVQSGIYSIRHGNINTSMHTQHVSQPQVIVQKNKTADEILAEAEAEKIKFQIEQDRELARKKSDDEFFESMKKNWKMWTVGAILLALLGLWVNLKK